MSLNDSGCLVYRPSQVALAAIRLSRSRISQELGIERLPSLSISNVRELLKATLPLPQVTQAQATRLVVTHLVHRSRSIACRLRKQHHPKEAP